MSSLTINGATTVTNTTTSLNVTVVSGSRVGVITVTGPRGAAGVDATGGGFGAAGVSSLNGLTGSFNVLTSGSNLDIRPVGSNLYIDVSGLVPSSRQINGHALTGDTTIIAADIPVGIVPGAGFSNLQQFINTMHSPGLIDGAIISDAGAGNAHISAGTGMLRVADDNVSSLLFVNIPASTIAVPQDLTQYYVGFVYNAGNPVFEIRNTDSWDNDTEIALGTVVNFFGTIIVSNNPFVVGDPITNIIQRFDAMAPITRDASVGGLSIGEVGSRNIVLSAGKLWTRLNSYVVPSIDTSSSGTMYSAYFNGLYWNYITPITQWDNINYNDITIGLVPLLPGYYSNLWFYLTVESNALGYIYDQSQYGDLTAASLASAPSFLPPNFTNGSILLGRLTFHGGASVADSISSAFSTTFTSAPVTSHNQLAGLQGGEAAQYYHLTAQDYLSLTGIADKLNLASYLTLSGVSGAGLNIGAGGSLGSAAFTNINTFVGTGNVSVTTNGQIIIISGAASSGSSAPVDVSGYITTGEADERYVSITGGQYVDLVSDQTINGHKSFLGPIQISGAIGEYSAYGQIGMNPLYRLSATAFGISTTNITEDEGNYTALINMQVAQLISSGGGSSLSVDWQNRQLSTDFGNSVSLDWNRRIMSGEWISDSTGQDALSLVTYGQLGSFISTGQSGQFYPVSNPQQYARSGDLQSTGQQAWGAANANSIANSGNLAATGSALQAQITGKQDLISGISNYPYLLQSDTERESSGLVTGGAITSAGPLVNIAAGVGYINDGTAIGKRVSWGAFASQAAAGLGQNYVSIDTNGNLVISLTPQSELSYIILGHYYLNPSINVVTSVWNIPRWVGNFASRVSDFVADALGSIIASGFAVTEQAAPHYLNLDISAGQLFIQLTNSSYAFQTGFTKIYGTTDFDIVRDTGAPNTVNVNQWNDITQPKATALPYMQSGYWKKDLVFLNSAGAPYYAYGQAQYPDQDSAKQAPIPYASRFLADNNALLYTIVHQASGTSIANRLYDVRPMLSRAFGTEVASAAGLVIDYSQITNRPTHNELPSIQGGTTDEYYHLTITQYTGLSGHADRVDLTQTGVQLGLTVAATGQQLYGIVTGFSGQLNTSYATTANLALTGSQAWTAANTNAIILSGNLTQTGLQIGLISGALATKVAASGATLISYANSIGSTLSGALTATGAALSAIKVSGSSVIPVADFSGIGSVYITYSGNKVFVSGAPSSAGSNADGVNLSGNLTSTGLAIGLLSGALDTKIAATGNQAWIAANGNGVNLSGNLTQTGLAIGLLSGAIATKFAASGAALITNINSVGATLSGNLTQTGVNLQSQINTITGNLITTGTQLTASIAALSGNLTASGALLSAIKVSGSAIIPVADFGGLGTVSVVYSGGRVFISGAASSAGSNADGVNLSGNLTQTGVAIEAQITSLSGFTINASGALQALIAAGGSVVKVSGSAAIPTADFSGIGGTVVLYSGGKVFISGATAGVGGGVPSVNGVTSAVTIAGTGGFSITSVGSTIYVSGLTTVNGGQVVFSNTGTLSGDANFTWDQATDTLEIGQPRLNYPDNPLSLGGSGIYLQANIRNRSNLNDASTDYVITSDVGGDTSGYLDLGMNGSNYSQSAYDMNSSGDGYLIVNGGNLAVATSSTGDVIQFFTSGTRASNLRMTINDTGVNLPYSGILQVGERDRAIKIDGGSIAMNSGIMFFSGIANNPIASMFASGWGSTYYGPALYNRRFKSMTPNTTTSQTLFGDTAANAGTLSTISNETLGQMTIYTPAAGGSAGAGFTLADAYRGTGPGVNGFFFVSKFLLSSNWASGLNVGTYGNPSGCRIFVGMTTQTTTTQVDNNEPVGNYVGLRYLWASGGSVGTGQYMQNWAVGSRDNVNAFTGDIGMTFQTGKYRFALFSPGYPGNGQVYYQLDDMTRGSGVKGVITTRLPVGSTAMRAIAALGFVSGVKTIGTSAHYVEMPND